MAWQFRNWIAVTLIVCFLGCNNRPKSDMQTTVRPDSDEAGDATPQIEPGFYTDGPEYDRISNFLATSNASVSLDYHQGIEWYDKKEKAWLKIATIEDIKPLLASTKTKHLVIISTGKAMWDKYDEYITQIAEYANESGFDMTVVTDDNAQGLVVSKVIQYEN